MEKMTTSQLLRSVRLRRTKVRKFVLEVLHEAQRPLSHQEIGSRLENNSIDRVTLYRTLSTLQQSGLLHRIQGVDGIWRFGEHRIQSGKCGGNHIHFLCVECNQMSCLPEQPLPWVTAPEGARVLGKQLVVCGICAQCATASEDG